MRLPSLPCRFAEVYFSAPGERAFKVKVNGAQDLSNFDPAAVAGPLTLWGCAPALPLFFSSQAIIIEQEGKQRDYGHFQG
jgi:hypothetical protein